MATVSIAEFAKLYQISMTAEGADSNPNMPESDHMDHWKCVLTIKVLREGFDTWHGYKGRLGPRQYSTRKMTVYFSQGKGHGGSKPEIDGVLNCLASDSSSVDQADFESWCGDMGYDIDSRKAEKTYKVCVHQAERLRKFLGGPSLYEQLLYDTESL